MLHRWSRSFYRVTVFLGLFGMIALLSCSGRQTSQETAPNTTFVQANTQFDDGFGYSIALSTDGGTLAVGRPGKVALLPALTATKRTTRLRALARSISSRTAAPDKHNRPM